MEEGVDMVDTEVQVMGAGAPTGAIEGDTDG